MRERIESGPEQEKRVFVSSFSDLSQIPDDVRVLHIAKQALLRLDVVVEMLATHPSVQIFQTPASLERLVGRGIRTELAARGIQLRFGRHIDVENYDTRGSKPRDFETRKEAFRGIPQDPKKKLVWEKMTKYGFLEAEIATLYYSGERKSIAAVARELSGKYKCYFRQQSIQRRLSVFDHWLGFPSVDIYVIEGVKSLFNRIKKFESEEREKQKQKEFEHARFRYGVGGKPVPEKLKPRYWAVWRAINMLLLKNPEALNQLRDRSDRWYKAIVNFYQLPEGQGKSLHQLGLDHGCFGQAVSEWRDKGLEFLGIDKHAKLE